MSEGFGSISAADRDADVSAVTASPMDSDGCSRLLGVRFHAAGITTSGIDA